MEEGKISKEDECRIAALVGIQEVIAICGGEGEDGKHRVFKEIGEMLGLTGEEAYDLSEKSKEILERGLTKDICYDFRDISGWVLTRSWEIMETEKKRFKDSIRDAWSEAKKKCAEIGAPI